MNRSIGAASDEELPQGWMRHNSDETMRSSAEPSSHLAHSDTRLRTAPSSKSNRQKDFLTHPFEAISHRVETFEAGLADPGQWQP